MNAQNSRTFPRKTLEARAAEFSATKNLIGNPSLLIVACDGEARSYDLLHQPARSKQLGAEENFYMGRQPGLLSSN
jgi:hypothetical protein